MPHPQIYDSSPLPGKVRSCNSAEDGRGNGQRMSILRPSHYEVPYGSISSMTSYALQINNYRNIQYICCYTEHAYIYKKYFYTYMFYR